jgi:8-oxo-dGTP pyrophosphatase MutT (NUDIX family)
MSFNCVHDLCNKFSKRDNERVRIAVLTKYKGDVLILLGKELYGWNKGKYGTCGGMMESFCYFKDAQRELREEFKIVANLEKCDYIINGIIVFILWIKYIDDYELNERLQEEMKDKSLSKCYKELEEIKWFNIDDAYSTNAIKFSKSALYTMKYIKEKYLK